MLVKVHQSSQSGGAVAMPSHLVQGLDVSGSPSFMVTLNWLLHLPHVYGTCIVVIMTYSDFDIRLFAFGLNLFTMYCT